MRRKAARAERPWALGSIAPGEEWLACTFQVQSPQQDLEAFEEIQVGADRIWLDALGRMALDQEHRWRAYTQDEVEFVCGAIGLGARARIIDVGCGDGRHSALLAERGYDVVGVDAVRSLIERGIQQHGHLTGLRLVEGDARFDLPNDGPFDAALLLYDVLGTTGDLADDLRILQTVRRHISGGSRVALSVMNRDSVLPHLPAEHKPATREEFLSALERLRPSRTMETTGNIFDPEHLLYFNGTFFRKEQFMRVEGHLPTEHIVRDRRYSKSEICSLLVQAGFDVVSAQPVQAGHWDRRPPLSEDDVRAREILVIAEASAEGPTI